MGMFFAEQSHARWLALWWNIRPSDLQIPTRTGDNSSLSHFSFSLSLYICIYMYVYTYIFHSLLLSLSLPLALSLSHSLSLSLKIKLSLTISFSLTFSLPHTTYSTRRISPLVNWGTLECIYPRYPDIHQIDITELDRCVRVEFSYYDVPHCTVLYCTVLYCTVLYCTVLYCTVLYCTILS